jgi:hypothetical protein
VAFWVESGCNRTMIAGWLTHRADGWIRMRAGRVGERHECAAVERAAEGREVGSDGHFGDDAIGGGLDEAHAEGRAERALVHLLEPGEV